MKHPKSCIFCGTQGNISKEHFWSEWLAPYLVKTNSTSYFNELHIGEGKQPRQLAKRSERQGTVNTKKIRVVCESCNNGWMSALESEVKPVLISILEHENRRLSRNNIKSLALWVSVKSIVGEYSTENTALTPTDDRHAIYKNKVIPSYFRIFAAYHSLQDKIAYLRHSTTVSKSMDSPDPRLPKDIFRNVQTTTFLVGSICFYIVSARVKNFAGSNLDPVHFMTRLWPDPSEYVELSNLPILDKLEISDICHRLDQLIQDPRVIYGGPLPRNMD